MQTSKVIGTLGIAVVVGSWAAHADAQEYQVGVAGAGPASLAYTLAAGLAENTNTKSDQVQMTAETSAGYVENIRLVGRGESEFGLTGAIQISQGLQASGPYEGEPEYEDMRGVAAIYEGSISWNAGEGISSVAELEGKTVSLGPPGSSIADMGERILEAYGISDNVEILRLSYEESSRAFVDGTIDAFMGGPAPYPAVMQAAAQRQINILPLDEEHIARIAEEVPVIVSSVPASAYDWLEEDVQTVGSLRYLITHKDVPEEAVYEVLSVNLSPEGIEDLQANHPIWNIWDTPRYIEEQGAFAQENLTLHPGAARYWEEQGVEIPAEIRP